VTENLGALPVIGQLTPELLARIDAAVDDAQDLPGGEPRG
jgi:hypothetical protein